MAEIELLPPIVPKSDHSVVEMIRGVFRPGNPEEYDLSHSRLSGKWEIQFVLD